MELRQRYTDYGILFVLLSLTFSSMLMGNVVMKWDAMDLYLPWKFFITDSLSNGELPLWNPFINSGFSQMGDPGTWYPVSWGFGFLTGGYSFWSLHLEYLFHLLVAGTGFYSLSQNYKHSRMSSLILGAAYMFSGLMIGNAQHIGWVVGAAWFPWVFLFFRKSFDAPDLRTSLKLALVLFLMLSGSYPAMFIITAYILFVFAVIKGVRLFRTDGVKSLVGPLKFLALSLAVFLVLGGVVLISSFDLAEHVNRGVGVGNRGDVWDMLFGSLSPQTLTSFFYPLATAKNEYSYWLADFSMINCYIGVIPVLLLLFVLPRKNTTKSVFIYTAIGLLFLMIAMGNTLPIRSWIAHLPFLDMFRFPAIFRVFGMFFLLLAVGFSIDQIRNSEKLKKQFSWYVLIATGIFGIINVLLLSDVEKWKYPQIFSEGWMHFTQSATIREFAFLQGGLLILLLGGLFILFRIKRISWERSLLIVALFEIVFFTRLQMHSTVVEHRSVDEVSMGLTDAPKGYPTPSLAAPMNFYSDVNLSQHFNYLWKNLSIYRKHPTSDGISPYGYLHTIKSFETGEFEKVTKHPLFFLARELDKRNAIVDSTVNPSSENFLQITDFSPNECHLAVTSNESQWLVFNQNHYPYWKATIDKKPVEIERVSDAFMAIPLDEGSHLIQFAFKPNHISVLAWVSIIGFVVLLVLLGGISLRKRTDQISS